MATTTPNNIPSPDSGSNYDPTVHMAALADGVQDALTERANYGTGTTAQMNAAVGRFPNGAKWFNTTDNKEYQRVGGAWVAPFADVPEALVTLSSGGVGSSLVWMEAVGREVFIRVSIQVGSAANGATIGTIPANLRPKMNTQYVVLAANSTIANNAWLDVSTSGEVKLYHYNTISTTLLRGSTSWVRASS